MKTILNTNYLNSAEAYQFLRMPIRNWQIYRFRLPFMKYEEEYYWKLSDLEDALDKLDSNKYLGEAQMVIELETYWKKFKAVVDKLNLPKTNHPFHTRILYRVSDIAVIRRAINAKKRSSKL